MWISFPRDNILSPFSSSHSVCVCVCVCLGIEDAVLELTMQTSSLQARLEEKGRQHQALQFQLQEMALQDQQPMASGGGMSTALLAPPLYPGLPANDPLPDFSNLSLEDADWFHEGIPRSEEYSSPYLLS